jgi:hypothetical protein
MLELISPTYDDVPDSAPAWPNAPSTPDAPARLRLSEDRRLWLDQGGTSVRVQPVRCFPWSAPGELVSLRDENEREQLLVQKLSDLDSASAGALQTAMQGVGFVLEVVSVESIEEDYEVRVWRTHTRHGKRTFQTKLDRAAGYGRTSAKDAALYREKYVGATRALKCSRVDA